MRRNKLVSQFRLAGDDSVNFVVDMNFIHEVLADVVKQLVKVAIIVVNITDVWRMITVLFEDGEGNLWIDAETVDGHEALISGLLLHDGE
jgi:hypothetical protein